MKTYRRFVVLIGAIILQICLGSIYTWSLFNKPIQEKFGWDLSQIVFTFSIAILFFAASTLVSGPMLRKSGPRKVATIGAVLYGIGVLATSFATSLPAIYITYGVIGGIGIGFAYVTPLATLVKWFPQKKSTITGVAIGAFGMGSIIFKPIVSGLLSVNPENPMKSFLVLGLIYLVLCTMGALMLSEPEIHERQAQGKTDHEFTQKEMIKTPAFYIIWVLFFLGCIPGLLAIGLAKNIGTDYIGIAGTAAGNDILMIALFNTLGRIGSGALADKVGIRTVVTGLFAITIGSLLILILGENSGSLIILYASLAGIAVGFGGLLVVVPSLVGDYYGTINLGSNYSIIFQAYGIAALIGPVLTNSLAFKEMFYVSVVVASIGLLASIVMKKPIKQVDLI